MTVFRLPKVIWRFSGVCRHFRIGHVPYIRGMDETDIVQRLMLRADAGDADCSAAAAEILRLRRIAGLSEGPRKRTRDFKDRAKALDPNYRRRPRGLPLHERVITRTIVDEQTGCWIWQGGCGFNGYARLRRGPEGKPVLCHRIVYEHYFGAIKEGLVVMHTCDNRRCLNPDHLRAGTQKENMQDMHKKGRCTRSVLTETEVREIRRLSEHGISAHAIANSFCVSPATIYNITSGRAWSWVTA